MASPVVGFVGPPGWDDPSPAEFCSITGVAAIGSSLDLGDFDWSLDRIATTEPAIVEVAVDLVERGATAIGIVGTPFGWAGLDDDERPQCRNDRTARACGVPVVSAASGMLDWLDDLGARRVALAATYYDRDWCDRWERFVKAQGRTVTLCASMADLDIVEGPLGAVDETYWAPTPEQIEQTVVGVLRPAGADAVILSGAGARTVSCHERLATAAGVPVVSADLGLYRSLIRTIRHEWTARPPRHVERPTWWPEIEIGV